MLSKLLHQFRPNFAQRWRPSSGRRGWSQQAPNKSKMVDGRHFEKSQKSRHLRNGLTDLYEILYTHTHPFNGPFSRTTRVSRYQKGKTNLDFTEARDSEWQWHQLAHMQVCTSLQTDNHASTPPLSFLHAGCPSCRPTNSVKALKAKFTKFSLLMQNGSLNFSDC